MIELGVDEVTFTLRLNPTLKNKYASYEWKNTAEDIIDIFTEKAELTRIFGEKESQRFLPQGYTVGYSYGTHEFYFCIAYNELQPSMNVVCRFSSQALDYYFEISGLKVYQLLQKVQDNRYILRLSRADLDVDYLDEDIDITRIYQDLMDDRIGIFRECLSKKTGETYYRRCIMSYQGYLKEKDVPTIYIGSFRSNVRLRIYDKKREQLERKGTKLAKAKKLKNWVRFESVLRNVYAHQFGDALLHIKNDNEFANLIACTMLQQFRFMYIDNGKLDCETEYTQMLMDCIINKNFILKSNFSRNYDIARSLRYLMISSGLMSTMFKIQSIFGNDGVTKTFDIIEEHLKEYEPNGDCVGWLLKNQEDYRKRYPDFDTFVRENLLPTL